MTGRLVAPRRSTRSRGGARLIVDTGREGDAAGRIEHLEGDQIACGVVVQDDPRLLLSAFNHRSFRANHGQRIGLRSVDHPHVSRLPSFCSLLLRYTVTTSAGWRSTSTTTRSR